MSSTKFMKAEEVANELGISQAHAYKIIKMLNNELKAKGYIVVSGRVSRDYLCEKIYSHSKGGDN